MKKESLVEIKQIVILICKLLKLNFTEVTSSSRKVEYLLARNICYKILKFRGYKEEHIAKIFNRDRSTVVVALKVVENDILTNDLSKFYWSIVKHLYVKNTFTREEVIQMFKYAHNDEGLIESLNHKYKVLGKAMFNYAERKLLEKK